MTPDQMRERMAMQQQARRRKVSEAEADLRGEHAKQQTLMAARHQNERVELEEKQREELVALAEQEKAAAEKK